MGVPLKWKKINNNGKVEINGSENTDLSSQSAALKVNGAIEATGNITGQGGGLSANDFTNAYKSKLDGIEAGAQVNVVESLADLGITASASEINTLDGITANVNELNTLDGITANVNELNILDGVEVTTSDINCLDGITSNIQTQLDNKVDKETGKGLSSNDFTNTLKGKLEGIGEVQYASWYQTSSASANVQCTYPLHLSAGTYIVTACTPTVSREMGWALNITVTSETDHPQFFGGQSYAQGVFIIELTEATDVYVITSGASTTTYSNVQNGYIRSIKIK